MLLVPANEIIIGGLSHSSSGTVAGSGGRVVVRRRCRKWGLYSIPGDRRRREYEYENDREGTRDLRYGGERANKHDIECEKEGEREIRGDEW